MTTPHATARLKRLFLILVLLVIPVWAHEDHVSDASTAVGQEAETPIVEQTAGETEDREKDLDNSILAPGSPLYRSIKYAGKFHVLLIHFPIAFLLGAAVGQWHVVVRDRGQTVVRALLWAGAFGAVIAATFGWMYAYDSVYFGDDEKLLLWHRWLGTAVAALAAVVLMTRSKVNPLGMAIMLTLCAALVAAAGHYGASLVYGPDFLTRGP